MIAWPHETPLPVQFRDLDCMGHVNNAVYLSWLEQVRNTAYLRALGRTDPFDAGGGLDFVVARAEIDYLAPSHLGDTVTIRMWPTRVGSSSFALGYDGRKQDGSPVLRAATVLVAYDWAGARSKPLSPELRELLTAGLGAAPGDAA